MGIETVHPLALFVVLQRGSRGTVDEFEYRSGAIEVEVAEIERTDAGDSHSGLPEQGESNMVATSVLVAFEVVQNLGHAFGSDEGVTHFFATREVERGNLLVEVLVDCLDLSAESEEGTEGIEIAVEGGRGQLVDTPVRVATVASPDSELEEVAPGQFTQVVDPALFFAPLDEGTEVASVGGFGPRSVVALDGIEV